MQFDSLFRERRTRQLSRIFKYFKYIFNDHFVISLMFILGAIGFEYTNWVKTLTGSNLLLQSILALVLLTAIGIGNLATYVRPADQLFLLPLESKWQGYFAKAVVFSLIFPMLIIGLVVLACYPVLAATEGFTLGHLAVLGLQMLILKYYDILIRYAKLKVQAETSRRYQHVFSLLTTLAVLIISVRFNVWLGLIITAIMVIFVSWYTRYRDAHTFSQWDWEYIVAAEDRRQQGIYRILSLFVDVPHYSAKARRRKYLDGLLIKPVEGQSPYAYLYSRAFWRGNQLFGLWLRLTAIGMMGIVFLPSHWLTVSVIVFVQYISHFQLIPLFKQYNQHLLLQTYPIDHAGKLAGYKKFINQPLISQFIMFALGFLIFHPPLFALSFLLFGLIFIYFFKTVYIQKRVQKNR